MILRTPDPTTTVILEQVRPRLAEVFGDRLRGVVLFGSEARGDADRTTNQTSGPAVRFSTPRRPPETRSRAQVRPRTRSTARQPRTCGPGVIYLRMTPSTQNAVHAELERILTLYTEQVLQGSFVVVEPGRHRIRTLASGQGP